jgi:hypothetical protein
MSKGNPMLGVRISRHTYARLIEQLERLQIWGRAGEYTRAAFIEAAIVEKLDKMERGRRKRPRKKVSTVSPAKSPPIKG